MKRIIPFLIVVFSFFGSANFAKSGLERVSMFRGNSELTGIYNSKAVNNLEQVKFIFKTMGAIRSSPVISGGILYIGSNDENFYAIDGKSGKEVWKFKTKNAVFSSICITGNALYFADIAERMDFSATHEYQQILRRLTCLKII